ncbi:universal stress protein [Egibacter rhizosphaerae]|nr:universal stress protein [Egibacter rhizosphaerae]
MRMFPAKVLVAVDGTPKARNAVDAAAELSAATGSSLHLLHVKLLSPQISGDSPSPTDYERAEQEGRQLLDDEIAYADQLGAPIESALLRMGRMIENEVVQVANEIGAGLLVLGTSARSPAGRRPHAGLSVDIARDIPCSVWFVREAARSVVSDPPPLREGTIVTRAAGEGGGTDERG